MINQSLLRPDGVEGAYHILDWRSQKTPRVARSSLGAEAQGGGQACDALEHVCVYWNCLLDPRQKLKELLDCTSTLEPTMITDAKALYDSFHREGYSSSVVDKRVSLEVKAMKERLLALGGNLRWMSSERQLADGLTKESARGLLAERLRYGKLKLVWDPTYKAAKKKTKDELKASLQESTFSSPPLDEEPHQALPTAGTELPENDSFSDGMPDYENHSEYVHMAVTNATVSYLLEACEYALVSEESFVVLNDHLVAPSHGVRWPSSAYDAQKLTRQSLQNERFVRDFLQKSSGNTHRSTHITQPCQAVSRFQPLQTTSAHTPIPMGQRHSPLPQLTTSRFPAPATNLSPSTRLTRTKYCACHEMSPPSHLATSRFPAPATRIALPRFKSRTKSCACHEK